MNKEPENLKNSSGMMASTQGPREALMSRLEAEESHCIARLSKLRELKLEAILLGDKECDVLWRLLSMLHSPW